MSKGFWLEITFEEGHDAPDGHGALGGELAEGELEEEERNSSQEDVESVRNQEGAWNWDIKFLLNSNFAMATKQW